MQRFLVRLAIPVIAAAAAGCAGGISGGGHAGPRGIRGTELPSFSCDAAADGTALRVAPSRVVELRLCPVDAPEPFNQPDRAIRLVRGDVGFAAFLIALSLPDEPADHTRACPAFAELLPQVIARTAGSAVLVHLPSDACGHILPAVRSALSAVEGEPDGAGQ